MVTINNSSLTYTVYKTIYDYLKTITFSASKTVTITAKYIDSAESMPQVVLGQPGVESKDYVFDRSNSNRDISIVIDVYTTGTGKNKDRSLITDKIVSSLEGNKFTGLTLLDVTSNPSLSVDNENKVLNSTISVSYVRR